MMNSFEIAQQVKSFNRVLASTAVIVVNNYQQILMLKRKGAHGDGAWAIPGGWLDAGEEPRRGACRELAEEVGVAADPAALNFIGYTFDQHPEGIEDVCLYFKLTGIGDNEPAIMEPEKIEEWSWIDIGKWPEPLFLPLENAIEQGLIEKMNAGQLAYEMMYGKKRRRY